jgi:molecular chaperone GrpE
MTKQHPHEHHSKAIDEQKKLAEEYLAGWQRAKADYLNFKREQEERFGELALAAKQEFLIRLLPVLDAWGEALKQTPVQSENAQWMEGMHRTYRQFWDVLEKEGLREVAASEGHAFDPSLHEAVEQVESALPEGHVVALLQKGYKLEHALLRPAKVKVSKSRKKHVEK